MTPQTRQPGAPNSPRLPRRAGVLLLAGLLAAVGCKSKELGGGGGAGKSADPLVVGPGRIPKQNIPVPDRGGTAGGKRSDPLIGSPTGRPVGSRSGAGYTDDPERWKKGPYIPGKGGTPAALAAWPKDGEGLQIESPDGVPLRPASGSLPPPEGSPAGADDALLAELARYGVKRGDYSLAREAGGFVFRVKVPRPDGGASGYVGQGPTAADAIKQALDQIRSDPAAK